MNDRKFYHVYLKEKVLFKNLDEEEFRVVWGRIFKSYWKDDLSYVVCDDDLCTLEDQSY
tara:strand:+ start:359 stop:535 length:177 start_codon:yes stop_codon:yes gene_type:complete